MGEGRQKGGRCRCGGAPTCNVTPLGGGFKYWGLKKHRVTEVRENVLQVLITELSVCAKTEFHR